MEASTQQMDALFEKAKAYLMRANKDGISVYDQLTRLMELILDENPEDLANNPVKFNEVLSLLQQHSFVQGESTAAYNEVPSVPPQELQRLAENRALFEKRAPEVQTTIEQPDPYTTVTTTTTKPLTAPKFESVSAQNRFWQAAGCGMADEEAFLLDCSITKLAMEKNLEDVRFAGKIFGTTGNYFVVSSRRYVAEHEKVFQEVNTMPKPPRKKVDVPVQEEPGFVGCNRLSFWVTSYPSAAWELLPDVTPQQINASRNIKRMFTGNLDAEVISSPPFPWSEAVYLRAQLARIVSSTYIAPQGAVEEAEEEEEDYADEEEEYEEGAAPRLKEAKYRPLTAPSPDFGAEEIEVAQYSNLDQWVHAEPYIYSNGRQTKVPEKPETEEEEEEEPEEPQPEDEELEEEPEEEEPEEEEEEKELFMPIRGDFLHAVVDIPQPPPPEDEEEEEFEEEEEAPEEGDEATAEESNEPTKPLRDDDIPDDDPTKMKVAAWATRVVNKVSKNHAVTVVSSLRWPGAVAYLGDSGKQWGCAYFGNGLKKTDFTFTPIPAPPVLSEVRDITEQDDPSAETEKLVRRGEEPPEPDSENELEEELEEEDDM